jgi:hypothetical protein
LWYTTEGKYEEVVVLPSITENAQALARTKGISYYEHRQLYHIALLRDPTVKRVVFLSSIPVGAHSFAASDIAFL